MTIWHLIPKSEEEMHDVDADCICGPTIIPSFRLEDIGEQFESALCYEHENLTADTSTEVVALSKSK